MSQTQPTGIGVKVRQQTLHASLPVPTRSRLYGRAPSEGTTIWTESLTSYTNRLGWIHGVSPKALVAEMLVPFLGKDYLHQNLGACCRGGWFMSVNGNGSLAKAWSTLLEQLTTRSDLRLLTSNSWIGDLPARGHLRSVPAWCPACYADCAEQRLPIYQPLLWMFRAVTTCTKHMTLLEDRCPHCQKHQSVITLRTSPGHCTQCNTWLGGAPGPQVDDETTKWQNWIVQSLEELRVETLRSGSLSWKRFFGSLATYLKEGMATKLARLSGLGRTHFYAWMSNSPTRRTPSLESLLAFCYICNVSPLQVMTGHLTLLDTALQEETLPRRRLYAHPHPRIDQKRCLELIRAVLDGQEEPLGFTQVAKRLGCSPQTLQRHFPQECSLLTMRAKEYRKQRKQQREAKVSDEVRQAVLTLHGQGVFPSQRKVSKLLSSPNLLSLPVARRAFHATRRQLGIER